MAAESVVTPLEHHVHIDGERSHVDEMNECAEEVHVARIVVPVEVNEVADYLGVKDVEVVRARKQLHERHVRLPIRLLHDGPRQ